HSLSCRADTAQGRPTQVLLQRLRFVEDAAPPVQTAIELDVAIEDLCVYARVDHHACPASEYHLAVAEQLRDQAVELFTSLGARENLVHPRRETRRVPHRLGAGCERPAPELVVRWETGELQQPAPHQAGRADEVEA